MRFKDTYDVTVPDSVPFTQEHPFKIDGMGFAVQFHNNKRTEHVNYQKPKEHHEVEKHSMHGASSSQQALIFKNPHTQMAATMHVPNEPVSEGLHYQGDAIGQTAMELNKVRDVTGLNFKPGKHGELKANIQGVFKDGFAKAFDEDPEFARKLLGSDKLTISADRESIVLIAPMTGDEIALFEKNAAAIGRLKHGDLRRAHEIYDMEAPVPVQGFNGRSPDSMGQTAMELDKARDVTGLNFKPGEHGEYKANIQGVFKNGLAKIFDEDPEFAKKLLGSDKLALSADRESIVLKEPMNGAEIAQFEHNAAAIGKLKHGDLRRAHEIYDLELQGRTRNDAAVADSGSANPSGASKPDTVADAQAGKAEALRAKLAAEQVRQAEAAEAAAAAAHRAEAEALKHKSPAPSADIAKSLNPQDKMEIAQVILKHMGFELGKSGIDGQEAHTRDGGFTGRALERFKNHEHLASPKNNELTDAAFNQLVKRYQQSEHLDTKSGLNAATVNNLARDQDQLKSQGVHVTHDALNPLNTKLSQKAEMQLPKETQDTQALFEQYKTLADKLLQTPKSDADGKVVAIPTPKLPSKIENRSV